MKDGTLAAAELDEAVRPILAAKLRLGLFEDPYVDEARVGQVLAAPEHRAEARLAAQRSMVLLRNEGRLLPLAKTLTSVAVIGPLADSRADTEGSWTVFGHVPAAITVLDGIRAKLPRASVAHVPGPAIKRAIPSFLDAFIPGPKKPDETPAEAEAAFQKAVETARGAELTILVLGELANMSGEAASRASLDLPGRQEELLEAVVALGKPVVLVLLNGRPLSINWAAEHVPAILEAWQPGTEGGSAVADLLFGDANPGGTLPVTFPRSAAHAPLYYARNLTHLPESSPFYRSRYWDGPTTPLYPFGYGLSYTTFGFSSLRVSAPSVQVGGSAGAPSVKVGGRVDISVEVENRGAVEGDQVVQLYVHQRAGSDSRPRRELKGFRRVSLKPREKRTVSFPLGPEELRYWSTARRKWVQEAEAFDVWVGADSTATLHAELSVTP